MQLLFHHADIPQVILLTQADLVCHAVNEDVRYVYQSRTVQMRVCITYQPVESTKYCTCLQESKI